MKKLTRVYLPIAIFIAIVFGITFIKNYSPSKTTDDKKVADRQKNTETLKFPILDATGADGPLLKYRKTAFEVDEKGHFDFWFRNVREQDVKFTFTNSSCQCAAAKIKFIPPDVWSKYVLDSALCGLPGLHGIPSLALLNGLDLDPLNEGTTIIEGGKKTDVTIPAASAQTGPQLGIIRLFWKGTDGFTGFTAGFVAKPSNAPGSRIELKVGYTVVPPYDIFVPGERGAVIRLGDLIESSVVRREFICWSKTRYDLDIDLSMDNPALKELVQWSRPERLSDQEMRDMAKKLSEMQMAAIPVLSAYRVKVDVNERREIERDNRIAIDQLDLGPCDFEIKTVAGGGKSVNVRLFGWVRGYVRLSDGENDRVDFGAPFPSGESRTKIVGVISTRPNLELELMKDECSPDYLDVVLTPEANVSGRKHWQLRVTVPAERLSGNLANGLIVLKTKEAQPRRFRIPIKASTFETGGPRF